MQITVFGCVWILAGIYIVLRGNIKSLITYTLLGMVLQSANVIILNGIGVGPQLVGTVFFICGTLKIDEFKIKVMKRKGVCMLMLFIAIQCVSLYFNNDLQNKLLFVLQLIIYLLGFFSAYSASMDLDVSSIDRVIKTVIVFVLSIGIIQFAQSIHIMPKIGLLRMAFFNDTGSGVFYNLPFDVTRLYSTFMEPSYCAPFLVGAFYYILCQTTLVKNKINKENYILLAVIAIEIMITQSATGYAAMVICALFYMLAGKEKKFFYQMIPIVMCILPIALMPFWNTIYVNVLGKLTSGSGKVRSFWNENAFNAFLNNPLLGVGYKNSRASSLIYTVLAESGVIGMAVYIVANCDILREAYRKRREMSPYYLGALFMLFSAVVCQIIACPDIDFCVYWMSLYIVGLMRRFTIERK